MCTEHKETNNRVLRMGGVRAQGMLERHVNTCPRRGSSKTGWRHVAGHNRALPGSRQEQKAREHHPLITTNNVPHSPQLHFWIVTLSHMPPASPVAVSRAWAMRYVALAWNPCTSEEKLGHFGQVSKAACPQQEQNGPNSAHLPPGLL